MTVDAAAPEVVLDAGGNPIDTSYFWREGCAAFALVLAARLSAVGVPADIAVISRADGEEWSEEHDFEFTHVVVSVPDGYVDAKGFAPALFEMAERIGLAVSPNDIRMHGDWSPAYFAAEFVGLSDNKPLYPGDGETKDWARRLIDASPGAYCIRASDCALATSERDEHQARGPQRPQEQNMAESHREMLRAVYGGFSAEQRSAGIDCATAADLLSEGPEEAFESAMRRIETDAATYEFVAKRLLTRAALSPLSVDKMSATSMSFDGFGQPFRFAGVLDEVAERRLNAAMQKNLASGMFEAAVERRSRQREFSDLVAACNAQADAQLQLVKEESGKDCTPDERNALALEYFGPTAEVIDELMERSTPGIRSKACVTDRRGDYLLWLAQFLYETLPLLGAM